MQPICVPSQLIRLSGKEFSIFSMQIIDIILFSICLK